MEYSILELLSEETKMLNYPKIRKALTPFALTGMLCCSFIPSAYAAPTTGDTGGGGGNQIALLLNKIANGIDTINATLTAKFNDTIGNVVTKIGKVIDINTDINTQVTNIYNFLVQNNASLDVINQSYYYEAATKIDDGTSSTDYQKTINDLTKTVNNMTQYGKNDTKNYTPEDDATTENKIQDAAYARQDIFGDFSALSSASLLSSDQITDSNQQKAAQAFVVNATSANLGIVPIKKANLKTPTSDAEAKYVAYQKTMAALQSIATNTYATSYANRMPVSVGSKTTTSKLANMYQMNTSITSDDGYWHDKDGVGQQGILPRALAFFTAFFSMNYNLNHISEQLERMNLQLAALITQNTINIQNSIGAQLAGQVQQDQPAPKFKSSK